MPKFLDPNQLKKTINFKPSEWQTQVLTEAQDKRFIVLACGRRSGKSLLAAYFALKESLLNNRTIWIVAPSYDLARKVFDAIIKWTNNYFPAEAFKINQTTLTLTAEFGSKIVCKSSENLASLLGESVNLVILDEVSRIPKVAWESYIRPCLTDTGGRAIFISTPFGKENHFYNLFNKGNSGDENWISFTFPSSANPYLPKEDLEEAKENLPEHIWKQEYEAFFSSSSYSVFRDIDSCIAPKLPENISDYQQNRIFFGLDVGKHLDYTCLIGMDSVTNEMVYLDRFNKINYSLQMKRIIDGAKKFKMFKIIVDSSGVGGAIVDELRAILGTRLVEDFVFTPTISKDIQKRGSKNRLIEKLASLIETKSIKISDNKILINELESFGLNLTDSGNITYKAPPGEHDDMVIALALASWELKTKETKKIDFFDEILEEERAALKRKPRVFQYK